MPMTWSTRDLSQLPPTVDARTFAELLGVNRETLYDCVQDGTAPVEPIRMGRTLRFPTARVLEVLGLNRPHETTLHQQAC